MPLYATSTDAVLLITKELRKQLPAKEESLDMFVEFFGPAVDELSIADRSGEEGSQFASFRDLRSDIFSEPRQTERGQPRLQQRQCELHDELLHHHGEVSQVLGPGPDPLHPR